MLVSQMITEARSIFNQTNASNSAITDTQLLEWCNQYYRRIQALLGTLPMKERDYTQSETVSLNARTLYIDHVRILEGDTSVYKTLQMIGLDQLIQIDPDFENTATNVPQFAVRTGTFTMRLYPAPNTSNQSSTVRTHGQEFPSDLATSDSPDLPLHIHDMFPHWMAYRAFKQLGQKEESIEQLVITRERFKELKSSADSLQRERRWIFPLNEFG